MLEGEIKIGDRLIWDSSIPGGQERVVVKQIIRDSEEGAILLLSGDCGDFWSSESRLRKMCVWEEKTGFLARRSKAGDSRQQNERRGLWREKANFLTRRYRA